MEHEQASLLSDPDQRTATRAAQALADDYKASADRLRAEVEDLKKANELLRLRRRLTMAANGTFAISWGRYGGLYWSRDYTTRLCLGWVAFTFYPFDFDELHNKQVARVTALMHAYKEAASDAARFREALDGLYGAVLHDMTARDLPHEWSPDSAMARASAALEVTP